MIRLYWLSRGLNYVSSQPVDGDSKSCERNFAKDLRSWKTLVNDSHYGKASLYRSFNSFCWISKVTQSKARRGAFSFATQIFREISLFILYLASSWIVIVVIVCATSVLLAGGRGGVVWGHIVNFTLISNICFSCRRSIRLAARIKLNPHLTSINTLSVPTLSEEPELTRWSLTIITEIFYNQFPIFKWDCLQ